MNNFLLSAFVAIIWFTIGTALLLIENEHWTLLGAMMYVIGIVIVIISAWSSLWDKFIEKTTAMQYLFDSARHLDRERLDALLHALGLKPIPVQQHKTDITIHQADHNNTITNTRNVFNVPVSIEQLHAVADALINQQVNYSRREIVGRNILTDQQYRNLHVVFEREKIVELRNQDNPNAGFKLSVYGTQVMHEYATSPTPYTEEVLTPA